MALIPGGRVRLRRAMCDRFGHDKRDVAKGTSNIDGLVKSLFYPFFVIPAKAGIQLN